MKIKKGRRRWVPYAQRIFGLGSELGLVEDFVRIRTTPTFNLLFLNLSLYLPLPSPTRTHSLPHIAPTLLYFPKFPLQKTYLFLCSSSLSLSLSRTFNPNTQTLFLSLSNNFVKVWQLKTKTPLSVKSSPKTGESWYVFAY